MANYKNNKKPKSNNSNKGKIAKSVCMLLLVGALFGGGIAIGWGDATDWTYMRSEIRQGQTDDQKPDEGKGGGAIITPGDNDKEGDKESAKIQLSSRKLAPDEYAVNGVSDKAESAYTLTATIVPSDATYKDLVWSVLPDDGKVTISKTGSSTATVQVMGPFDTQHIVTVKSFDQPEVSKSCKVDYLKEFLGATAEVSDSGRKISTGYSDEGSEYLIEVTVTPELGVGTVEGKISYGYSNFTLETGFYEALNAKASEYQSRYQTDEVKFKNHYELTVHHQEDNKVYFNMPSVWDLVNPHATEEEKICKRVLYEVCSQIEEQFRLELEVEYLYGDDVVDTFDYPVVKFKADVSNLKITYMEEITGLEDIVALPPSYKN